MAPTTVQVMISLLLFWEMPVKTTILSLKNCADACAELALFQFMSHSRKSKIQTHSTRPAHPKNRQSASKSTTRLLPGAERRKFSAHARENRQDRRAARR